ncbi:hypothetical protein ACFL43_04410 [Thermodesulfobacteriota bacterium]
MKYCPKCGGEFYDSVSSCEDCRAELLSQQEWDQIVAKQRDEDQEIFIKIKTVENQFEADVLKDALEKENIPVLVRSFQDTSFNGLYIPQKGWGILEVPEEFRAQAKEILEVLEQQSPQA